MGKMLDRRGLLRELARFSAAAAMGPVAGCLCDGRCGGKGPKMALQLYSIYKIFWKSPERILDELKAAGFDGVEFAGIDKRSAADIRRLLGNAGLEGAGTHVNGDKELVGDALARTLDFYAEAGVQSIVTPHAKRDSADAYRAFGRKMGEAAEEAAKRGIRLGVHTAPFHFNKLYDGKTAWEWITAESSPLLQQEIDVGNVVHGGGDAVAVLEAGRGRHFVLHAKENDPTAHGIFGEKPTDGGACVPWGDVMAAMRTDESVRWWIIESEVVPDSTEPSKRCLELLRSWL